MSSFPVNRPGRREFLSALASPALALTLPSFAGAQGAVEKIRVASVAVEAQTPLYFAIKNGAFQRAGLDVEFVSVNGGPARMATVIAGTYELASSNLLPIFTAHLRGIPLVIVAPLNLYTPQNREAMLQIAVDSPFKTGADLNNKTIGVVSLDDINTLAAKAWVDKNGGNSQSLKFVEVPNGAEPEAVAQHRIDAAIVEPPVLEASIAAGTTKTLGDPMGAIASSFMIAAFVSRTDWASGHADAVRKFDRTLADATDYVNAHHSETAPLVAEFTKTDLAVVAKMSRTFNGTKLDAAQLQPLIDVSAKYGLIARSFPAHELFWSG